MSHRKYLFVPLLLALITGLVFESAHAGDTKKKKKKSASKDAAATCRSQMLRQSSKDKSWKTVLPKDSIPYGDLLMGGYGASLINTKGTVQVTMLGDLTGTSPFPILETAFRLNPPSDKAMDLEFTLERGRVDLINKKKTGAARVRVHVQKSAWDLTLSDPETRVALELYGRWPRNLPFIKEPTPDYGPQLDLVVLVLSGHVDFKTGGEQFHLSAPPGPALIQWDSVNGWDKSPTPQDKLPAWADDSAAELPAAKARKALLLKFRNSIRKSGLDATLEEFLESDNPEERRLAIVGLGATDNLEKLGEVLTKVKHPDVWENAVVVLRHWIGRGPGQDQILYQGLVEKRKMPPAHAATILQLLHGFSDINLARPETYEVLIEYLSHDVLGIRGLAHWHLQRLVPAGKNIAYSPLDPPEARLKAQAEWRKLMPNGKLPPKPSSETK